QGLAQCEFVYKGDNYKKKAREISNAWNQTYRMKGLVVNPITTAEYNWWSLELGKKIEQLEEEKMQLGLDVDVQKLEVEKIRKGNNKVNEDLGSLKTYYKKLRFSMRTVGLGKTSEG
ncbi:hypothetical protein Gotur_032752, partial [Gossypium turneri]